MSAKPYRITADDIRRSRTVLLGLETRCDDLADEDAARIRSEQGWA